MNEDLVAAFNSIEWRLSPLREELHVTEDALTTEQQTLLHALKKFVEYSSYSGGRFTLYPPSERNEIKSALWSAAFPAAEERLKAALETLAALPWRYNDTSDKKYFLWKSELTEEQVLLIEDAPEYAIETKENGEFFVGYKKGDIMYLLDRGMTNLSNRLRDTVHDNSENTIDRESVVIANLPWQFDEKGQLVLDAETVTQLSDNYALTYTGPENTEAGEEEFERREIVPFGSKQEVGDILARRNVKFEGGKYVLEVPNTTQRLHDQPDGDVDHARMAFHAFAGEAALERNKPLMSLPWRFDTDRWVFVVRESDLSPFQRIGVEGSAFTVEGPVLELRNLKNYAWRASGPQAQVADFLQQLEGVVPPDLYIADLAELPWKYTHEGMEVPKALFTKSKFYRETRRQKALHRVIASTWRKASKENSVPLLPGKTDDSTANVPALQRNASEVALAGPTNFETSYDRKIIIHREKLEELPYYAAIKAGIEKRFDLFVSSHAEEIRALPWSFELRDDIKYYGATKLYAEDLTPEHKILIDHLIEINQLHDHIGREYKITADHLFVLLQPQFEVSKSATIAKLVELPWEHLKGGIRLNIPDENLSPEQRTLLERSGIRKNQWGSYSTSSGREGKSYSSNGDEVLNDLRAAIAHKLREREPAKDIPKWVMELPWQFAGRFNGRNIVLDNKNITDKQKSRLETELPDIEFSEHSELFGDAIDTILSKGTKGYFELIVPGDHYLVRAILDKPYYDALLPVAERKLEQLVATVATYPWRLSKQGEYELSTREVTKEQQRTLAQIPEDFFDRKAEWARVNKYSHNRFFVAIENAFNQTLIFAIRTNAGSWRPSQVQAPARPKGPSQR